MHILDLDLDFFLNHIAYSVPDSGRQTSSYYKPWSVSRVRSFLENRLGISTRSPIEGRVVVNHDGAFDFWGQLIKSGKLSTPFNITHIDSHSDLGLGNSGYIYLMTELLKINPKGRFSKIKREQVECGDYLAFAIACRWVSKLHWIYHLDSHDDLPIWHFKVINPRSGIIQLRRVASDAFDNLLPGTRLDFSTPPGLEFELPVPFKMQSWRSFKPADIFNYIVLSQSPGFTPVESDQLIPIVTEYMHQI